MTRPLGEPSGAKKLAAQRKGIESLARRPAPPPPDQEREIKVFGDAQLVTTGDQKFEFEIPESGDGMNLVAVESYVTTVSSSGKPTVQIRNRTQTVDMLSTKCEIDASEFNSKDAATQAVIDTANDDVAWGDHIAIDVDVAGTGAQGLGVILTFALP